MLPGGRLAESVEQPVARTFAKLGIDAGTTAGMNTAAQLGATTGTAAGVSLDPKQVANAAIGGAAAGAAVHGAGAAADAAGTVRDNLIARGFRPADADHAQAVVDAQDYVQQAAQSVGNANGRDDPFAIANSAKKQAVTDLQQHLTALRQGGYIDANDASDFRAAIDQARRNNNSIGVSDPDSMVRTILDRVQDNAPEELIAPFVRSVRALDVLSTQSFRNKAATPFANIGAKIGSIGGKAAAGATGLEFGGPVAAMVGFSPGGYVGGKVGSALGGMVDNALGTSRPDIYYQNIAAQRMLGNDAQSGAPAALQRATVLARGGPPGPDPAIGLTPDPIPVNQPTKADPTYSHPQLAEAQAAMWPLALRLDTPQSVREGLARDQASVG
jgi:hypothetical protein